MQELIVKEMLPEKMIPEKMILPQKLIIPKLILSILMLCGGLAQAQEAGSTQVKEAGPTQVEKAGRAQADEAGPARTLLNQFSGDLVDLQVQFTQVVTAQNGVIQDQTFGHAALQSPDKLNWVYAGDFPEIIVADGKAVWIYDKALDQITVKPQSASVSDTPLLILTDISQLDEQFVVTEMGDFEDMRLLELRSRAAESEFERVLVGLDTEGIKMMVMEDAYGQRTEIRFTDLIKNADIDPGLFSFTPPEGVDVVGQRPLE